MKKRKNESRVWRKTGMWAAFFAAAVCVQTGCVPVLESPVIGETRKEAVETDGSEHLDLRNTEENIWLQVQVPERYQVRLQEENLNFKADAPVEIPLVNRIPRMEIQSGYYEEEDFEKILETMKKTLGVNFWKEEEQAQLNLISAVENESLENTTIQAEADSYLFSAAREQQGEYLHLDSEEDMKNYASDNGIYLLTLGKGRKSDRTPMVWLKNKQESTGFLAAEPEKKEDGQTFSVNEQELLEKELQKKARQILEEIGISDIFFVSGKWRTVLSSENAKWEDTGKHAWCMRFVRTIEGIPVINKTAPSGRMMESMAPAQYIDVTYKEDGTILELKDINNEKIIETSDQTDFLLPFEAVTQILEQQLRYEQAGKNQPVFVTKVLFGYQLCYDEWDAESLDRGNGEGRLIPVWAFYEENGSLLLTINAEDGTIYAKE